MVERGRGLDLVDGQEQRPVLILASKRTTPRHRRMIFPTDGRQSMIVERGRDSGFGFSFSTHSIQCWDGHHEGVWFLEMFFLREGGQGRTYALGCFWPSTGGQIAS